MSDVREGERCKVCSAKARNVPIPDNRRALKSRREKSSERSEKVGQKDAERRVQKVKDTVKSQKVRERPKVSVLFY